MRFSLPTDVGLRIQSNESGRPEIYVRPFNASSPSLGDGKWQVSRDGGTSAKWRSDGKEIYFQRGNVFFAAEISANGAAFQSGTPKRLFEVPIFDNWTSLETGNDSF
jgi:hypothetical protein